MQEFRFQQFEIRPGFCFLVGLSFLVLPLRWVFSWLTAAAFHEACHYGVLKLLRVDVRSVRINGLGAVIETGEMSPGKEILSALSGPIGGLCLILLVKVLPCVSVCALVHSLYNLIPVFPLDGGRVACSVSRVMFGDTVGIRIYHVLEILLIVFLSIAVLWGVVYLKLGVYPIVFLLLLIAKNKQIKIPCKEEKLIVQ